MEKQAGFQVQNARVEEKINNNIRQIIAREVRSNLLPEISRAQTKKYFSSPSA